MLAAMLAKYCLTKKKKKKKKEKKKKKCPGIATSIIFCYNVINNFLRNSRRFFPLDLKIVAFDFNQSSKNIYDTVHARWRY